MTRYEELFEMLENHSGEGCLLWPYSQTSSGYGGVWLDGKLQLVHRVACEWAHGSAPEGKPFALHAAHEICGNRTCCAPTHLRWGNQSENLTDAVADGTNFAPGLKGESHGMSKLTEAQVVEIRERYAAGDVYQRELAAEYGVDQTLIGHIVRGKIWTHVGGPIKGVHYA